MGQIGAYAEGVGIVEDFFLGIVFDTFGRKYPVCFGLFIAGLGIGFIPAFTSLYPGFVLMRILVTFGTIIGLNLPLLPDYVQTEYMGRANAYIEVIICVAIIVSTTGILQIVKLVPE